MFKFYLTTANCHYRSLRLPYFSPKAWQFNR